MKKSIVGRRVFLKNGGAISAGLAIAPLSGAMPMNSSSNNTPHSEWD
jgi:hypothetical protein